MIFLVPLYFSYARIGCLCSNIVLKGSLNGYYAGLSTVSDLTTYSGNHLPHPYGAGLSSSLYKKVA